MNGWVNFFVGEVSAAAALTGLVFVGISINLKKIMESAFLPNHALEALVAFVTTLFIGLLMLIPQQSFVQRGIEVLIVGALNWILMIALERNTLRKVPSPARTDIARIFVFYQLAAISCIGAGVTFLVWGAAGFYWIVAAIFLSYLAAFIDTWLLVVEINR